MYYRTRTYIAGDWDHDKDAVEALHRWNESSKYGLSFSDAHELCREANCWIVPGVKCQRCRGTS